MRDLDERFLRRALQLAERARGHTSPNPLVGAVLVREGRIVGEGFQPRAGEPQDEVFALQQAGELARGAAAYVTLEPCLMCHHALAQAGVEVVYGAENLKEGALTRFGLPTRARGGVRERECAKLLRDFFARLREGCRSG